MHYCAIIGDIVNSKELVNRQEVQCRLDSAFSEINTSYSNDIASNFAITIGDEFQGLLYQPSISYKLIKHIKKMIEPVRCGFGVGIGELYARYNEFYFGDGPAWHYARKMVDILAKKKEPSIRYFSNSNTDELINALLILIECCVKSRTPDQTKIIQFYEEFKSQQKVAHLSQITHSSINKMLNNRFYYEVINAEIQIEAFLSKRCI